MLTAFTGGAGGSGGDGGRQRQRRERHGRRQRQRLRRRLVRPRRRRHHVGNTIIDLNQSGTNLNNNPPGGGPLNPTSNQVGFGTATIVSQGNNLIGVLGPNDSTAFTQLGDQTGITAAQLNFGPLQNNGGPTPTDGLLQGSVAIDAGSDALATAAGLTTDQRGSGFPRKAGAHVDVGAFELQPPIVISLNPPSVNEGSPSFTLTITGTGFTTGAVVNFGTTTLTPSPSSVSQSQIQVTIAASFLDPAVDVSSYSVSVSVPDASGLTGPTHVITSNAVTFNVTEPPVLPVNNPGDQTNNENVTITPLTITSPDADANSFTDLVGGVHTLPPGLSITSAGVISGTISTGASIGSPYTVTITALDDGTSGSTTFKWTVNFIAPPTVNNPGTQTNNESDNVSLQITATGADPNTFTETGLPPGLSISPSGLITGIIDPRAASTPPGPSYTVTITATHQGVKGSTTFTWNVNDTTPPALTNPGRQVNHVGDMVSLQISATDADSGSFSAGGTLPPGLSINATGLITGTVGPTAAGTYTVTITAADGSVVNSVSFIWVIPVVTPVNTAVLGINGSLTLFNAGGGSQQISPPGTILAISTAQDSNGVTAVYAITTGLAGPQYQNRLFEYYAGNWSERSSGQFLSISATTSMDGGAIVFGVLTDHSLWEEHVSFGLDTGWAMLSPAGTIQSITPSPTLRATSGATPSSSRPATRARSGCTGPPSPPAGNSSRPAPSSRSAPD